MSVVLLVSGSAHAGGTPCQPGSSGANGIEPCTPCEAGTFAPNPGATFCEPCPIGAQAPSTGSASCALCDPGTYADQPGAIACTACAPGSAVDYAGAPACVDCPPGFYADQTGQTACLLCSPGAFAAAFGSTGCEACPRNAYQPTLGASACLACGCDDGVACTRDACDATTGACTAPPVPGCQPRAVSFAGTVTYTDPRLASPVPVGGPVTGTVAFDPEAPDHTPLDPALGDYPNALTSVDVVIGSSPQLLVGSSTGTGSVSVENDWIGGDEIRFALLDSDGLVGPTFAAVPDALPSTFLFSLRDVGATALASDALPETPLAFAPFGLRSALLELSSPTVGNLYVQADGVNAPEPLGTVAGAAAIAVLGGLARRRR